MDNQHKQIKGYRDLSQTEIDLMNEGKSLAIQVGEWIAKLQVSGATHDQRAIAMAKLNCKPASCGQFEVSLNPRHFN